MGGLISKQPDFPERYESASGQKRTAAADGGVGLIVPVAGAVGGGIGEKLALRARAAPTYPSRQHKNLRQKALYTARLGHL